ncbi:MAG TPA: hypothetical protein VN688_21945 [Gemmataceae bacterium]|nr:hypothetical protein [Gemmataceae bacterium]
MSRRSLLLAIGIFLCLTSGVGTTLWMLVRYEPRIYLQAAVPPGEARHRLSADCSRELMRLYSSVTDHDDQAWEHRFTDEQINSYLAEHFVSSQLDKTLLPEGISQPRIVIEADKVRVAFRYGSGLWSTVVSIDLRLWLVKGEPNVVALKLVGFHAGALPISAQSLLERISETCLANGIGVDWYRDEGFPVALLRFQTEQPHPTLELELIKLEPGAIHIQGRTKDPASLRAFLETPLRDFKLVSD